MANRISSSARKEEIEIKYKSDFQSFIMYKKKQSIKELKENDRIEDIFVVKIKKGISPYVNGYYFHLLLSDHSGQTIDYKYWGEKNEEDVKKIYDTIKADSVVFVQGRVQSDKHGRVQISTNPPDTIEVLQEWEYDPKDFIMPPQRNIEDMTKELNKYIENIRQPDIKRLLSYVFIEDEKIARKFRVHPGAIEIHHNWTGGLLQHTLEVAKICELAGQLFNGLDNDILIAGALLHDIGKLKEIKTTTRIKGTVAGQLQGHIAIGYAMLSEIIKKLGVDEIIANKLLHIVISHHGWQSFGSPKEPMFPEALVVYYADELSSKISEFIEFKKNSLPNTEDEFMYNRRHKRNIYLR